MIRSVILVVTPLGIRVFHGRLDWLGRFGISETVARAKKRLTL
jgi:hypothetical protein